MSDHWKTLARLLGAPGAADPPKPKPQAKPTAAKPTAAKPTATKPTSPEPATAKPTSPEPARSGERSAAEAKRPIAEKTSPIAGEGTGTAELPGSLPGFGPPAAPEPAEVESEDIFSGFGKPRAEHRSESPTPESRQPESRQPEPEAREPVSPPRHTDKSEPSTPAAKMFSEPIRSEGPSSWDELVDRLGIPAAPSPQPRLADSEPLEPKGEREPAEKPERGRPQRSAPSRPKSTGGGFGGGLGLDAEPETPAPEASRKVAPEETRQESGRKPPSESPEPPRSDRDAERDPLEELGEFGWGTPRRGRADSARRTPSEDRETRPSRSREEAPREEASREEASREEASREEASREERGRSERRPEGRRGERARSEGARSEGPAVKARSVRGSEEPAAEKSSGDESLRGEGAGGRPRRGRRRGQRQRMSEDQIGWAEEEVGAASRDRVSSDFDEDEDAAVGFVEEDVEDDFGALSELDEETSTTAEGEDGDQPQPRRRRRRGRRRRGGSGEAGTEASGEGTARAGRERGTAGEEGAASEPRELASDRASGRASDSEFDDDHEDDDEAVALRRSRRGRRRRTPVAEADAGAGEDTPRSSNYGAEVDGVEEDEGVLQNTQRNIPTWTDTVALLVNPNMEARKRDPQRGGGGGGRSRGRRRD